MKALYLAPGEAPQAVEVPEGLQALQRLMGGRIEAIPNALDWVYLLHLEERDEEQLPNRMYKGQILYGPIYVVGRSRYGFKSLTAGQVALYRDKFRLEGV